MKPLRLVIALLIALLVAGCTYAYLRVNDQTSIKINSLRAESKNLSGDSKRGEYVAFMGGCIACHTNIDDGGDMLAGGVPIKTPFGTFYSPNITSDLNAGIGKWTTEEFLIAMTAGVSPEQEHYFPVFPYTAYSVTTTQDLIDLKAWLDTVEPVSTQSPDHDLIWPFSIRSGLFLWKAMFFDPLTTIDTASRGSYLVNGPGHCAECHSPRNLVGGLTSRSMSGNSRGPDGESVPGITPEDLSTWSVEDIELFLEVGITPTGDFTGGHMTDVIEYGTSELTNEDRTSIAEYLLSKENSR